MPFDIAIIETGNGGDLQLVGNDLAVVEGIENMPYLAMFGGNKQSSISPSSDVNQPAKSFDWWGNNLLMPSSQSQQFNSLCEKAINTTELTSSGRASIENKIIADLDFLTKVATVEVAVTIVATDRIDVNILIKQFQQTNVVVIKFKKATSGDFSVFDFNSDFFT